MMMTVQLIAPPAGNARQIAPLSVPSRFLPLRHSIYPLCHLYQTIYFTQPPDAPTQCNWSQEP
jgi:hypothetical protein